MGSYTEKTKCSKCGSDDCNYTINSGELATFKLIADEVYCNTCGYYSRRLMVNGKEVIRESD